MKKSKLYGKFIAMLGTVAVVLSFLMVAANACSSGYGETEIPDALK